MAIQTNDLTSKLAFDANGVAGLKQSAKTGSPEALKQAATQFEAMFINMMMKSMRDATPQDGMLDNQQTKTFTTMLDQQMSQNLAKRGVGLADVLVRQLGANAANAQALAIGGEQGAQPAALAIPADAAAPAKAAAPVASVSSKNQPAHIRSFQEKLGADAEAASKATGIPAKFMLGQAALESGWGKREIRNADGSASHNLFGIKAGPGWKGKVVNAVTTEYVNGVPQTRVEKFRAYDSYADSFKDYAKLLSDNPRYEKVLASAGDASKFAHGLQKAGYATDPHYAAKLSRIITHSLA
ncbi:flagellar assembly peptidoglycan hydrolase FlgJ [Massilia sp. R2A-15]|uniref:flagellar assembly peptidoglycan hydrolase FlgJ n=1 Tax=Massilia sp. R2A-15 TaxID=3064278 RepID=UPI0027371721|nr:flagellar assembly peptidoglycan hydrolase FlgJ [Massilia sp. R2A-15]WLI87997.1 flagellar assembly peptidoglycan hydrolase FlgJ [Massilia sp. R2A-15]